MGGSEGPHRDDMSQGKGCGNQVGLAGQGAVEGLILDDREVGRGCQNGEGKSWMVG